MKVFRLTPINEKEIWYKLPESRRRFLHATFTYVRLLAFYVKTNGKKKSYHDFHLAIIWYNMNALSSSSSILIVLPNAHLNKIHNIIILTYCWHDFLAVQDSSIGDLVTHSVIERLLIFDNYNDYNAFNETTITTMTTMTTETVDLDLDWERFSELVT